MEIVDILDKVKSDNNLRSDAALARLLGVNRSAITRYRSGQYCPKIGVIQKLASISKIDAISIIDAVSKK